jgi:dolichyl-phosphate-mannose-protein mannosyltransferase
VTASPLPARPARWTALDTAMLTGLTALAGALRFVGITRPRDFVFDEFYASDGCLYFLGPQGPCRTPTEISIAHPPLAKWLIGLGIRVFGFTPAGWRVAPLVAGTLTVAVLYLLARRLLGSTLAAALAAGLLAFDFLHFVMSRSAMLDVFVVAFGLTSFLCLLYDRDRDLLAGREGLRRRPWLLAAGVAGGAALASKWSGGYLLAAVAGLAVLQAATRYAEEGDARPYRRVAREEGAQLVTALVLIPVALYVASYAGRLDGTLLAWPWEQGSWVRAFLERQQLMLSHHTGALFTHPYSSPAWSWPFLKRPVLFYLHDREGGGYQEILAMGNPLVWWPGLLALAVVAWQGVRRRSPWQLSPAAVIVAGFAAGYAPWFILSRREAFLYYFLPAVPFLCLALGQVVAGLAAPRLRGLAIAALTVASLGMFAFFRPVLAGTPLPYPQWRRRMVFSACGGVEGGTVVDGLMKPMTKPVPAPPGWCWV